MTISQNCLCQIPNLSLSGGNKNNSNGGSLVFAAINITMTSMNIMDISSHGKLRSTAGFGIVTGVSQITYGLIYQPETNRNEFMAINVGIGTATLLVSSWRLFKNKESKKNNATSWNLFFVPVKTDKFGVGISLTRKI